MKITSQSPRESTLTEPFCYRMQLILFKLKQEREKISYASVEAVALLYYWIGPLTEIKFEDIIARCLFSYSSFPYRSNYLSSDFEDRKEGAFCGFWRVRNMSSLRSSSLRIRYVSINIAHMWFAWMYKIHVNVFVLQYKQMMSYWGHYASSNNTHHE